MSKKKIGLVAHDEQKDEMVDWCKKHQAVLSRHDLYATGTTGAQINEHTSLTVTRLKSGPLGGDAQLGAMIVEENLDICIFFIDPLTAMPHDVDVKALTRLATLYNVPFACNPATANAIINEIS